MVPYVLWLHGLLSGATASAWRSSRRYGPIAGLQSLPCQAYGRKAIRLVEVWPGPGQVMVTEVMPAADDVSIHALDPRRYHAPRYQNAGAPGCPRRHTRLKGHLWRQCLIGIGAHPW